MPMREDEMRKGMPPMGGMGSPPMAGPPAGPPGPPMEGPAGPPMDMPPGPPMDMPQEGMDQAPIDESALPNRGQVTTVEGDMVVIQTDTGETVELPMESFPFPPNEGDEMVRSRVVAVEGEIMVVMVGEEGAQMEVPTQPGFNPGDFFWMPEPPGGPPAMEEPMMEEPMMDEMMDMPLGPPDEEF